MTHLRPGLALAALAVLAAVACTGQAKTAEEAQKFFFAAVGAKDPLLLFDALDQQTRWSWMTIQRSQREAYDIVAGVIPEGPEHNRLLARFEAAATTDGTRAFFGKSFDKANWSLLPEVPKSPSTASLTPLGEGDAQVLLPAGQKLLFRKGNDNRWGFAGLAHAAEQVKRRAMADLEQLRTSAADYERAAARSAK